MDEQELIRQRIDKFKNIGGFVEGQPVDPVKKRALKKRDKPLLAAPTAAGAQSFATIDLK